MLGTYQYIENLAKLANVAREKGMSIVHVPISFKKDHPELCTKSGILNGIKDRATFKEGTFGAEIHPSMAPVDGDTIVQGKSGLCGFYSTNLDFLLRQRCIKNVMIGGLLTNCCMECTMRTAYEASYSVYTLMDCTCATSVEAHESMFKHNAPLFLTITNSGQVQKTLE